jgi:hypothetical protein
MPRGPGFNLLFEGLREGVELCLELGLALLNDLQSQLIPMKLDCRVMNMPFDFVHLSLRLAQRTLQFHLPMAQIVACAPIKMVFLWGRIPSRLNRFCELRSCRLQKLKRRPLIFRDYQPGSAMSTIHFHPCPIHVDRQFSAAMRAIEHDVALSHLDTGALDLIWRRNAILRTWR